MAAFEYSKALKFIKGNLFEFKKLLFEKKKLNLGSNSDIRPDYINVDILSDIEGLDLQCDLLNLHELIPAESIDELLAYDLLEHFPFAQTKQMLADWICWLAPGGKIIVRVPDIEKLANALVNKTLPIFEIGRLIMGGQDHDYNYHKACFDGSYLEGLLIGAGCKEIIQIVREPETYNVTVVARK